MNDELLQLIDEDNSRLPEGWKFEYDAETEDIKLLKLGGIQTEDGSEDERVATIHVMEDFLAFIESEAK